MESRGIARLERCMGLDMFVFYDGSVMNANDISVSLFEEVRALRSYGNKDCTAMADDFLDGERFPIDTPPKER